MHENMSGYINNREGNKNKNEVPYLLMFVNIKT